MTYSFSFQLNNFLTLNNDGSGSHIFPESSFNIPSHYVKPGMPNNLSGLVSTIPANYLFFNYHVSASGFVGGHQCFETYTLYNDLSLYNGGIIKKTPVVSTSPNPNNGGNINSGWVEIPYTGNSLPYQILFYQGCSGSGCIVPGCTTNGWDNISISLQISVTILSNEFCAQNPHLIFCEKNKSLIPSGSIDTFSNVHNDNYLEHQSYWRRNRAAIIWFIVIILVIVIIIAIVVALDHKKCSKWLKSRKHS